MDEKKTNDFSPKQNVYKREIHTFVKRAGHFTNAERKDYENLIGVWGVPFCDEKCDFEKIFGNKNPVTIEIGFGMGKATSIIAQENPQKNYLGIEVHTPGVGKLLGEIRQRELKNIKIIEYDAMQVLEKMIKDESVEAFHIFFADPWPKKRHHKRRLIQRPRTDLMASKLKKGGYLYFVTDWLPYAEFALEELNLTKNLKNKFDGFAPHQTWRPETRFEQKGLDANRVITELFFEKV